jgi:hypothetical protein
MFTKQLEKLWWWWWYRWCVVCAGVCFQVVSSEIEAMWSIESPNQEGDNDEQDPEDSITIAQVVFGNFKIHTEQKNKKRREKRGGDDEEAR